MPTSLVEAEVIDSFHKIYYESKKFGIESWGNTYWMGIPVLKCPLDLWLYQEIIYRIKPDFIIETGTAHGGSALYLAHLLDILGNGKVITIDINSTENGWKIPEHPRIEYLFGDSVSQNIILNVFHQCHGKKVLAILDSDHKKEHVLKELSLYSHLIPVGSYVIVEDTNINGNPVGKDFGEGPREAVLEFMKDNKEFAVDVSMGKFFMSFNPFGYLIRTSGGPNA